MPRIEYKPHYNVCKPMSLNEMAMHGNKSESVIRHRLEAIHGRCMPGTRKYSAEVCNKVLNAPVDRENWEIEGYLPLAQATKRLGVTTATTYKLLEEFGLPFVQQHIYGIGSVWISEDTLRYIEGKLSEAQAEATNDYMSSLQVAKICDVDREYVNVYARRLKITKVNIRGKYYYPKAETKRLIEVINQAHSEKKKETKHEYYKAMKKKHPLVRDVRCFDFEWFPDPIPAYMKEW